MTGLRTKFLEIIISFKKDIVPYRILPSSIEENLVKQFGNLKPILLIYDGHSTLYACRYWFNKLN